MKKYYVNANAQLNGDHEVHHEYCIYLPKAEHRIYVGFLASCKEAIEEAKKYYQTVDGCKTCARDCHQR